MGGNLKKQNQNLSTYFKLTALIINFIFYATTSHLVCHTVCWNHVFSRTNQGQSKNSYQCECPLVLLFCSIFCIKTGKLKRKLMANRKKKDVKNNSQMAKLHSKKKSVDLYEEFILYNSMMSLTGQSNI